MYHYSMSTMTTALQRVEVVKISPGLCCRTQIAE